MTAESVGIAVELPAGPVTVPADYARPPGARATIALTHGAGSGREHPFLVGLASALNDAGLATLRFDLPYRAAGRRMPGPPAHAVAAWRDAMAWLEAAAAPGPLWASGKSYGGRMASVAAAERAIAPAGLVYLGYPLHPPGQPDKARTAHLPDVLPPQLFLSGTGDPFVDPHSQLEEAVAACRQARLVWIEGGNHSFEVKGRRRPAAEIGAALAEHVAAFVGELS
ncbi:alpha/beta hydrolase family protein [Microbacterium sp. RD1]|uniref:alpha/beta hydrolase family protein n=1 Tax=Microbacterium sp. RD1 TaxID=3457313 RepID=UPI003FA5DD74